MSRLVIEATVIYTLIQFLIIIFLVLGKIVNFLNSFERFTFAAGMKNLEKSHEKMKTSHEKKF